MEGALKVIEKFLGWIFGIAGSILSVFVMYQYTGNEAFKKETRADIADIKKESLEKYMLKSDCQRESGKLYTENREAHLEIFRKLDKINETQSLILQELGRKADRA